MKKEDIADLKQLIEFLKEHGVGEFDLDRGDMKIRLKFNQPAGAQAGLGDLARLLASAPQAVAVAPAVHSVGPVATGGAIVGSASSAATVPAIPEEELHIVKSPIVGTYYGSPSPGAAAFVSPGDHVEKGQVICIVEAMKLMNEIESDATGEIVKCFVSNGQPIEFGQPLFSIRTS
jgi:acetyl-CoA carboxylase biotin carboxyl carrier protein